jgi:hypothetical protein
MTLPSSKQFQDESLPLLKTVLVLLFCYKRWCGGKSLLKKGWQEQHTSSPGGWGSKDQVWEMLEWGNLGWWCETFPRAKFKPWSQKETPSKQGAWRRRQPFSKVQSHSIKARLQLRIKAAAILLVPQMSSAPLNSVLINLRLFLLTHRGKFFYQPAVPKSTT